MSKISERVAAKFVRLRTSALNVVAPNSIKSLMIPENFDVWREYKKPGIKVFSGGNDWEAPPTCFMLLKKLRNGESERLWVQLVPPEGCDDFGYLTDDEKERGLTEKEKEERIKHNGEEFLQNWEDAARRIDGEGLPSRLKDWAEALKENKDLHSHVELSGSDKTTWKKTNLLKNKEN